MPLPLLIIVFTLLIRLLNILRHILLAITPLLYCLRQQMPLRFHYFDYYFHYYDASLVAAIDFIIGFSLMILIIF